MIFKILLSLPLILLFLIQLSFRALCRSTWKADALVCRTRKPPARTPKCRRPQDLSSLVMLGLYLWNIVSSHPWLLSGYSLYANLATLLPIPEKVLDLLQTKQGILVRGPCRSAKEEQTISNELLQRKRVHLWGDRTTIQLRSAILRKHTKVSLEQ